MMRKTVVYFLLLVSWMGSQAFSQTQTQVETPTHERVGQELIQEWFKRLNALDDWFISMDGKEETDSVVSSIAELYEPDALQILGPNEYQIGTVTMAGTEGIRKWAENLARRYVQLSYRIEVMTVKEKSASLVTSAQMPWKGGAVSAEFTFVYSERKSRRRFMVPGAVFLNYGDNGKIQRARLYFSTSETAEVFP